MSKSEVPGPTSDGKNMSKDFLLPKGTFQKPVPYYLASGFPETPEDVARREEKIEQIRQGKY